MLLLVALNGRTCFKIGFWLMYSNVYPNAQKWLSPSQKLFYKINQKMSLPKKVFSPPSWAATVTLMSRVCRGKKYVLSLFKSYF